MAGDSIELAKGVYKGNFFIDKSIKLTCNPEATIDGDNKANTILISANNVLIKNCSIINWGDDLTEMNAGLFVEKTAANIQIESNHLKGKTFGIWLDAAKNATLLNNQIEGDLSIRSQDRGNGIHLYNVTGALVQNNEVWNTRDGIYIDTSNDNQLIGNTLHDLRYGIHYMYSHNNRIENNQTYGTRTGYALMQSKYLTVTNNTSENDTNYGILMNFIAHSTISKNRIMKTSQLREADEQNNYQDTEGKGFFIYNSPYNTINDNLITKKDIGIHLTAGSEENKIYRNHFIQNKKQVKYIGTRKTEWSFQKQGNFWSDYQGWDRNADGVGDEPFQPNDNIDKILWKYPSANLLINSPAIQTLHWVQKMFPVLSSPGITDSYPMMKDEISEQFFTSSK